MGIDGFRVGARCRLRFMAVCAAVMTAWAGMVRGQEPAPASGAESEPTDASAPVKVNRFLTKLSADEPLYFVVGSREFVNAKFQISFKYSFMNPRGELMRRAPFFSHVYFGYTQTSLWDIEGKSKPFYDTSYKPSLFFRDERISRWSSERSIWGWQTGIQHESNGQGPDESRSLNIIYVQPIYERLLQDGGRFSLSPKLWTYIGDLSDNPDIADYRGYGELRIAWTGRSDWQVATTVRVGTSGRAGVQVDGTWPMDKILSRSFDAYLYAQVFNGWGESLRSYDQRLPWQFRVGIAVVR